MSNLLRIADYLWLAAGIVWLAGALTSKRTQRTQSSESRLVQVALTISAYFLLFVPDWWGSWLRQRLLPEGALRAEWTGLALTAAGLAFAIWARLWIGRNWSGRVTIKEQHELIRNGPYSLVRHPIYSGLLLAVLGTAIIIGELRGLLAFPLATLGFTLKLRVEESFMAQQFGDAYSDYKRRVKALVPFIV